MPKAIITVQGDGLQNYFTRLIKKTSDFTPLTRSISETMLLAVQRNFDNEGRPQKWIGLSPVTIKERMKNKVRIRDKKTQAFVKYKKKGMEKQYRTKPVKPTWPGKILQRQGQAGGLLGSVNAKYDSTSASVGTNKTYAKILHFGGKAGKGLKATIPARPYMLLTDYDISQIRKLIQNYLEK